MPNIKPVSDLKNYSEVLRDIAVGEPVFLTKNGRGCYALLDIIDYEKMKSEIKLMSLLSEGEISGREEGWLSIEDVESEMSVTNV